MKKYLIFISIFTFIFTIISFAVPIIEELRTDAGIEIDADLINIETNYDGSLQAVSYIISSTRLNKTSTTTYQTSEVHVKLGNGTYIVKTDALKKNINPKAGEGKVWHRIYITAEEIKNTLTSEMGKEQLNYYLQNPSKIEIGAKIDIMQNGESVASIEDKDDIEIIAEEYGFIDKHFEDMRTRFKPANTPIIPREKETTPKMGLRPTIIIDDSEEEY